jgi:hypothetical protein
VISSTVLQPCIDVVLESADGAELLRLPIVVWSGGG